jgi:hypothetical protein
VPKAIAAIAWIPPIEKMRVAPAMSAATIVAGAIFGEHTIMFLTPATFAGITVINAVEGSG